MNSNTPKRDDPAAERGEQGPFLGPLGRLMAAFFGLSFIFGSISFIGWVWRDPPQVEATAAKIALTAGGVLFAFIGIEFVFQALSPDRYLQMVRRSRDADS